MKTSLLCTTIVVALAFSLGLAPATRAASQPAPAATAAQPTPPKSFFTFDPKLSKDPFFPKTQRFASLMITNDAPLPPAPLFPEEIHCKGFSGTPGRPLAIINNKTVAKGESFDLSVNGQRVRVRCVDIVDKRVVLEVNGVSKELKLRGAIQ